MVFLVQYPFWKICEINSTAKDNIKLINMLCKEKESKLSEGLNRYDFVS